MGQTTSTIPSLPFGQIHSKPHFIKKENENIKLIITQNITYSIDDIVSFIDDLGYEKVVKIIGFSFDQQSQKYVLNLEGDDFNVSAFIDSIKEKKNKDISLSTEFNLKDHIIVNVNGGDVVAEITGIQLRKNANGIVDKNGSTIDYRYSNGNEGKTNFWSFKKVPKDTPLTSPIPLEKNKKYTLEDDSRYRFKYAKYKAKYLAQKNN
jgi:hypothetical protein